MKKLFVLVTLLVCGAAIIFGNVHWNHKISAQGAKVTNKEEVGTVKGESGKGKVVSSYSSNLPEKLQEKLNKAATSGKPLKLVIYGTNATTNEEWMWPNLLSKELIDTYGKNVFEITVLSTGNNTTHDIVNNQSYKEINELQPDILLFEPSMLKDNGNVGIENSLHNVQTMVDSWQEANKDLTLMIQPPNPLYSANFYPIEISQLQEYAEKNDMIYLNHWENWPDLEDPKMEDYLTETNDANKSGHEVWADYLIDYFVGQ